MSNTDWSWGPLFADFDNDGFKDLFIANGIKRDFRNYDYLKYRAVRTAMGMRKPNPNPTALMMELVRFQPTVKVSNYIFKNNGDLTFTKKTTEWGMDQPSYSNGSAFADLDNDGDLDIVVNNVDEEAFIYKNNSCELNQNHYLRIKLNGPLKNPSGIGAKIIIKTRNQLQLHEHYLTRGYQSSVENIVHFGLGKADVIDKIEITWPDAKQQQLTQVKADQVLQIDYQDASSPTRKEAPVHTALFEEFTKPAHIKYKHKENSYNDFAKEALLPHRMSTLGPGAAVGDVNGDGLDDFFIGAAKGYAGKLFLQQPGKTFKASNSQPWFEDKTCEDMGAAFFDADNDGDLDLYVVSGGSEFEPTSSKLLALVRQEVGIPVITEVMDPRKIELVCKYADIIQIGSRNMHNSPLLTEVGQCRKPVILKRGMSATIEVGFLSFFVTTLGLYAQQNLPKLVDVTRQVGITFVHNIGDDEMSNLIESNVTGCAFFDYDGDSDLDIYLANGTYIEGFSHIRGRKNKDKLSNALYRNNGDGTFTNIALQTATGFGQNGEATSAMMVVITKIGL